MKRAFYLRLAWDGVRKNKKLYVPYILTCVGTVAMFYIVSFLSKGGTLSDMRGGHEIQFILQLGTVVLGVFALLILFYTNSFLIRRRKKEFGLYNILGMDKGNLSRVLIWESLILLAFALVGGLAGGILFSKLAELLMVNILETDAAFTFTVNAQSIATTAVLFAAIFFLILLNSLRQIHMTNPVELLKSESTGEKPPKANWFMALVGVLLLGGAYVIAVMIKEPMAAIYAYFIAVIMVILGTYLLFIAGSVALCKALQKNKRYYYKTNHFVSVSTMAYRMKRNGAGLASICILSTMVLVMVSCTVCLYFGMEDGMRTLYPRNITVDVEVSSPDAYSDRLYTLVDSAAKDAVDASDQTMESKADFRMAAFNIGQNENGEYEVLQGSGYPVNGFVVYLVPLEDYNRVMGQKETLAPGQALIYEPKSNSYNYDTLSVAGMPQLQIMGKTDDFICYGADMAMVTQSVYVFTPDFDTYVAALTQLEVVEEDPGYYLHYLYGFDVSAEDAVQIDINDALTKNASLQSPDIAQDIGIQTLSIDCAAGTRTSFLALYGGLFFLGILLGIVFSCAAVLIMYYKQLSEGYEDQARFDIMQKVGMTKREIKKSINSQMLTVFFAPLLLAGTHLAFNFPLINRTISLLGFQNMQLLLLSTVVCFLVFALLYMVVYRVTSGAYYKIVSSGEEDE